MNDRLKEYTDLHVKIERSLPKLPQEATPAPNGDIFVAEKHGGQNANAAPDTVARISKFKSDGTFVKSWGKLGTGPGEFRTPHALAFDSGGTSAVQGVAVDAEGNGYSARESHGPSLTSSCEVACQARRSTVAEQSGSISDGVLVRCPAPSSTTVTDAVGPR